LNRTSNESRAIKKKGKFRASGDKERGKLTSGPLRQFDCVPVGEKKSSQTGRKFKKKTSPP